MTTSDKLYVVRLANNGGLITTIVEVDAREIHAKREGSTLSYRPFPSTVKMPYVGKDYTIEHLGAGEYSATYTPLGVSGYSDEPRDAYSCMLRAIRDHLERETEVEIN